MHNNNGMVIDCNSIIAIVNKLELYIENEEKTINSIRNSFDNLEDYYSGKNTKIIEGKKNQLLSSLDTALENKKRLIDYLNKVVEKYELLDKNTAKKFNDIS